MEITHFIISPEVLQEDMYRIRDCFLHFVGEPDPHLRVRDVLRLAPDNGDSNPAPKIPDRFGNTSGTAIPYCIDPQVFDTKTPDGSGSATEIHTVDNDEFPGNYWVQEWEHQSRTANSRIDDLYVFRKGGFLELFYHCRPKTVVSVKRIPASCDNDLRLRHGHVMVQPVQHATGNAATRDRTLQKYRVLSFPPPVGR